MKTRPVEAELFYVDRRTDGRTDTQRDGRTGMTKPKSIFGILRTPLKMFRKYRHRIVDCELHFYKCLVWAVYVYCSWRTEKYRNRNYSFILSFFLSSLCVFNLLLPTSRLHFSPSSPDHIKSSSRPVVLDYKFTLSIKNYLCYLEVISLRLADKESESAPTAPYVNRSNNSLVHTFNFRIAVRNLNCKTG